MRAAFSLTPAESRRLIAKAVVQMDEVQYALNNAYLVISAGTSNAYVAQEILGTRDIAPEKYAVGISTHRVLCITSPKIREKIPVVLYKGIQVEKDAREALDDFHKGTVIIKGANAIDAEGRVGIILGGFSGGGVGETVGTVVSQGLRYIVPVGLEKMVASVPKACQWTGAKNFDYTMGADYGMMQLPNAVPVTEIDAFRILAGVDACHIASGGVDDSAGCVMMAIQGDEQAVRKAIGIMESVKGEPALSGFRGDCENCRYACVFKGYKDEELPAWLRD